jgi:hypothetical protein
MAAPHVAGVAALVWSQCPGKTAQEIRQVLESTAQDLGSSGRDIKFGNGLVRADLAYNSCKEGGGNDDPIKGYEFTPFKDSGGYDIRKSSANDVQSYARECNQDSNCKGFNSNGWLKHHIRDSSSWYRWTNDVSKGFYLKLTPSTATIVVAIRSVSSGNYLDGRNPEHIGIQIHLTNYMNIVSLQIILLTSK